MPCFEAGSLTALPFLPIKAKNFVRKEIAVYFLKWNYDGVLSTCSVVYELEPYFDRIEFRKEEQKVQRLQELCEVFNEIAERINQNGFPNLCPKNHKDPYETYPLFHLAKCRHIGVMEVRCNAIVGGNWANRPEALQEGYPKPRKLQDLLVGYLNLNEKLKDTKSLIPPIPVYKIMDDYFCEEGNHRLYATRLLGFKTIKAEVMEYDYISFLKETRLYRPAGSESSYIAKPAEGGHFSLHEISELQAKQCETLKRKHLK